MKMCQECLDRHKKEGWYISAMDGVTKDATCDTHPVMTNKKVFRTLKTIKSWSLEPAGYEHKSAPGMRLTSMDGEGWVYRPTAERILFDYEQAFLDFLLDEEYLESLEGTNGLVIRLTEKGDNLTREREIAVSLKG